MCLYIYSVAHILNCFSFSLYSLSVLGILLCIWGLMPPATSPTFLSCAYRKPCRVRTISTCTFCSTLSLQACRFIPRLAQMAAAVSLCTCPVHSFTLQTTIHTICKMFQSISSSALLLRAEILRLFVTQVA